MKVKELYDFILTKMTAEEALLKLLEGAVIQYEKLKFPEGELPVHPIILISRAALDMGWEIAIETREGENQVRGLCVGTKEYMDSLFKLTE